jgi:tight adherence protein C
MNVLLFFSSISLVAGGLLIAHSLLVPRRQPLAVRLARSQGIELRHGPLLRGLTDGELAPVAERVRARYLRDLRRSGSERTLRRFLGEKLLVMVAAPFVLALPYLAVTGRLLPAVLLLLLAVGGFFVPDLVLHGEIRRRREAIFLDLPEAISILTLALGAGQSLARALALAGRDCAGPLAEELERALTLARREQGLDEREALARVAREAGEPTFRRFAELLAAKESPYLDFLRQQAREARAEQNRYLERAADRAYLSMHAPLAPLLAVLVLLIAYGFLRFLAHTV